MYGRLAQFCGLLYLIFAIAYTDRPHCAVNCGAISPPGALVAVTAFTAPGSDFQSLREKAGPLAGLRRDASDAQAHLAASARLKE